MHVSFQLPVWVTSSAPSPQVVISWSNFFSHLFSPCFFRSFPPFPHYVLGYTLSYLSSSHFFFLFLPVLFSIYSSCHFPSLFLAIIHLTYSPLTRIIPSFHFLVMYIWMILLPSLTISLLSLCICHFTSPLMPILTACLLLPILMVPPPLHFTCLIMTGLIFPHHTTFSFPFMVHFPLCLE